MEEIIFSINTVWVLIAAALVFFMQAGFALVEAGFTRSKNTANILMKNLMDFVIGTIIFWLIGFGIMFGTKNGFWGGIDLFTKNTYRTDMPDLAFLIFQTVFAATAATIVSGAMAERTKFNAYLVYSGFITLIIYPISGHWAWGGGWLSQMTIPFHDFAGSTVVHSVGGWTAMVGALILGPPDWEIHQWQKSQRNSGAQPSYGSIRRFYSLDWLVWIQSGLPACRRRNC